MTRPRQDFGCIATALIGCTLLIGATVFLTQIAFDGMDANMMRFESEPAEGWEYWRNTEFRKGLPGLFVLWGLTASLVAATLWLAVERA